MQEANSIPFSANAQLERWTQRQRSARTLHSSPTHSSNSGLAVCDAEKCAGQLQRCTAPGQLFTEYRPLIACSVSVPCSHLSVHGSCAFADIKRCVRAYMQASKLLSADATHVEGRDVHVSVCTPADSRHPGPYLRVPRNALVASALRRSRGPRPEYKPAHQRPGPTQPQRLLAANVLHKAVVHLELAAFQRRFGLTPLSRQEGGGVAGMHKQAGGSRKDRSSHWRLEDRG